MTLKKNKKNLLELAEQGIRNDLSLYHHASHSCESAVFGFHLHYFTLIHLETFCPMSCTNEAL